MHCPLNFRRLFEPTAESETEENEIQDEEESLCDSELPSGNSPEVREALRAHLEEMMGHTEASNIGDGSLLKALYQGYDSFKKKFFLKSGGKGASAAGPSKGKSKASSLETLPAYDSSEPPYFSMDPPGPTPDPPVLPKPDPFGSIDYKYIKKCSVIADGKPVMGMGGENNSKYDATLDFVR